MANSCRNGTNSIWAYGIKYRPSPLFEKAIEKG